MLERTIEGLQGREARVERMTTYEEFEDVTVRLFLFSGHCDTVCGL